VGQAHSTGKDVTEGRSPHRPRLPDSVGPDPQTPTALRGIANKANAAKPPRCRELSRCWAAERFLNGGPALQKEAASGVAQGTAEA
jgi:hypothetical protein